MQSGGAALTSLVKIGPCVKKQLHHRDPAIGLGRALRGEPKRCVPLFVDLVRIGSVLQKHYRRLRSSAPRRRMKSVTVQWRTFSQQRIQIRRVSQPHGNKEIHLRPRREKQLLDSVHVRITDQARLVGIEKIERRLAQRITEYRVRTGLQEAFDDFR